MLLLLLQAAGLGLGLGLLVAAALALLFLAKCIRAHFQLQACPIPGPPSRSLVLGHISDIYGPKGVWVLADWANKYGPLYKVRLLSSCVLLCSDPEAIARVTRRTGPAYMPKSRAFYLALETAIKPRMHNILTANDGDYWKAVRQGTAPCFSVTNMKTIVPMVVDLTNNVAQRMAGQRVFDVADGAKRITSDIMGHLLLGEDLGGTRWQHNEYLDVVQHVICAQARSLDNPLYLWCMWLPEVRHANDCMARHNSLMDAKVASLMQNPPPEHTIAAHLLRVKDPATGRPLTANQVKAEIAIFMAAGFETTSHAISWTLAMLACHPEVQEQVFQELLEAGLAPAGDGSSPGRDFLPSDLGRLTLLGAVYKEALRLCAPAPFGGSRLCTTQGAEMCGYIVDKGMTVMMSSLPIALAKHCFGPDATEFRPDRWLPAASSTPDKAADAAPAGADDTHPQRDTLKAAAAAPAAPAAAAAGSKAAVGGVLAPPDPLTFMCGARDCIGQNLAKLELQVVLSTLLSRFRFRPGPELQRELDVAAAMGQPVVNALYALAGVRVTLQPLSGVLELCLEPRAGAVHAAAT